jgi:hypothetical protein
MKKTLLFSTITAICVSAFVYLSSFTSPENQSKKGNDHLILVEVYEIPQYEGRGIYIHMGDGKTIYKPFKAFKEEHHKEGDNGELILNAINELEDQGFDITHMTSGLADNGMITKIFMRKTL